MKTPIPALTELRRVLKSGGELVIGEHMSRFGREENPPFRTIANQLLDLDYPTLGWNPTWFRGPEYAAFIQRRRLDYKFRTGYVDGLLPGEDPFFLTLIKR